MTTISMFHGVVIRMHLLEKQHNNLAHIRVECEESEASIAIENGEVLAGELPHKQLRLVQAWIELHRNELVGDWILLRVGDEYLHQIAPL
jgi:hypothetical protein